MSEIDLIKLAALVLSLVVAIVGHEIMHGYVAYKYGDNTAKSQGRLNINPIIHVDPVGTLLVPTLLYFSGAPFIFGWAKPVPVNINTVIRNGGIKAAVFVALAGVSYNFLLAIICSILLPIVGEPSSLFEASIALFLYQSIVMNVLLGVFNLWPIPPLDGANAVRYIAAGFNLKNIMLFYDKIFPYGMILLIVILATPVSDYLFQPVSWIVKWLI